MGLVFTRLFLLIKLEAIYFSIFDKVWVVTNRYRNCVFCSSNLRSHFFNDNNNNYWHHCTNTINLMESKIQNYIYEAKRTLHFIWIAIKFLFLLLWNVHFKYLKYTYALCWEARSLSDSTLLNRKNLNLAIACHCRIAS